jgi:hypothetical protein
LLLAEVTADQNVVLLVSNRHVLQDPTRRITIDFHAKAEAAAIAPILGETRQLDQTGFSEVYFPHPDPEVDLACLNATEVALPENLVYYKALKLDQFATFEEPELLPGASVWFVGYPENRFDTANNLPILRRGHIASIPTVDFNARPQFVIDAQVFPGSSGSPVFAEVSDRYLFVGVVTQTMIRNQQLESVPSSLTFATPQPIGLGIVLKAHLVQELVAHTVERLRELVAFAVNPPTLPRDDVETV